ncbi:Hint domain-containing protein [Roseovarius sp. EL26]|uniref:Hint domain-containing protein n=1 Tax=Roseovarius sp. EL26 TaxID=2126672 RepID=UPI0013C49E4D|nr:Hint domain-containing protein [Roseovarius sp. EL26]
MNFFGTTYNSIYINSNGLITFTGPNTTFNAPDLSTLTEPAIAPFWTDVNVSGGSATGSNNIYWDIDPINGKVTITWFDVEAFSSTGNNTFQVVLSSLGDGTVGIEFIYENIEFSNGFGAQAQVGVTDGGSNDLIAPGSGNASDLLNLPTTDLDPDSPDGIWDIFVKGTEVVCFLEHTLIETDLGQKPVQWLRKGDMIATLGNGFQPLIQVLRSRYFAYEDALPIRIEENALNNTKDLFVSQLHHVLIAHPVCELLFGEYEVFVAAKDLLGLPGVHKITKPQQVTYYHLLLDDHQAVYSNEHPSESFFAGDLALLSLESTRNQMHEVLAQNKSKAKTSHLRLKHYEACILVDALMDEDRNQHVNKPAHHSQLDVTA